MPWGCCSPYMSIGTLYGWNVKIYRLDILAKASLLYCKPKVCGCHLSISTLLTNVLGCNSCLWLSLMICFFTVSSLLWDQFYMYRYKHGYSSFFSIVTQAFATYLNLLPTTVSWFLIKYFCISRKWEDRVRFSPRAGSKPTSNDIWIRSSVFYPRPQRFPIDIVCWCNYN